MHILKLVILFCFFVNFNSFAEKTILFRGHPIQVDDETYNKLYPLAVQLVEIQHQAYTLHNSDFNPRPFIDNCKKEILFNLQKNFCKLLDIFICSELYSNYANLKPFIHEELSFDAYNTVPISLISWYIKQRDIFTVDMDLIEAFAGKKFRI